MKKKLLLLMALCLFASINTFAYDAEIDGIYYNFSEDKAIVTYQRISEYSYAYNSDYTGAVIIPESVTYDSKTYNVTRIGDYAFANCTSLTSVTIPESVTSIGKGAFSNCPMLISITIPNSVTSIGSEAFRYCTTLTSVNIPESVTSIGDHAFYNCSSLTSIIIPNSVTSIEERTFTYCI